MKEILIDYIEEILFFIALILISISAFIVNIAVGLFISGLMMIVAQDKIIKIKKSLVRKR